MRTEKRQGVTIVELTVVILILSILASVAISVYTGYLRRARFTVCRSTIHELGLNITRYEVDLGEFPPSASYKGPGALSSNASAATVPAYNGSGYLTLALLHSMSGDFDNPSDPSWFGPYMDIPQESLGDLVGNPVDDTISTASVCILDPWGLPYNYVRWDDYLVLNGTEQVNTPFNTMYYNPNTFQIYSLGPNGTTPLPPGDPWRAGLEGVNDPTTEGDDVNNFYTP